jgi:hypothetical protein
MKAKIDRNAIERARNADVSGHGENCFEWKKPSPETAKKIARTVCGAVFCYGAEGDRGLTGATEQILEPSSGEIFMEGLRRLNEAITGDDTGAQRDIACITDENGDVRYCSPSLEIQGRYLDRLAGALLTMENKQDKAALAYYAVVGLHPFRDGNGRVGRLVHDLILNDGDLAEEHIEKIATHNAAESGSFDFPLMHGGSFDLLINREVARGILGEAFMGEHGQITANSSRAMGKIFAMGKPIGGKFPEGMADRLMIAGTETGGTYFPINGIVLTRMIQEYPELGRFAKSSAEDMGRERVTGRYYGEMFTEDRDKSNYLIKASGGIDESLTKGQARRMMEIYDEVKMRYLDTLTDIFVNPEHFVSKKSGKTYAEIARETDAYSLMRNIGTSRGISEAPDGSFFATGL